MVGLMPALRSENRHNTICNNLLWLERKNEKKNINIDTVTQNVPMQ